MWEILNIRMMETATIRVLDWRYSRWYRLYSLVKPPVHRIKYSPVTCPCRRQGMLERHPLVANRDAVLLDHLGDCSLYPSGPSFVSPRLLVRIYTLSTLLKFPPVLCIPGALLV